MADRSIYIDAYYLLAHQENTDEGRFSRNVIGRCENMKNRHGFVLKTPMIALGEAASKCCFEGYNPYRLTELMRDKEIDTPVPDSYIYELSSELIIRAGIDPCDALITSHALLDPTAQWLLTTDETLLMSRYIKRKIRDLGINSLRINDRIG